MCMSVNMCIGIIMYNNILDGKVHTFAVLFTDICGKSVIFTYQTTQKLHAMYHSFKRSDSACFTCTYMGVTNIEFSMLHACGTIQH